MSVGDTIETVSEGGNQSTIGGILLGGFRDVVSLGALFGRLKVEQAFEDEFPERFGDKRTFVTDSAVDEDAAGRPSVGTLIEKIKATDPLVVGATGLGLAAFALFVVKS